MSAIRHLLYTGQSAEDKNKAACKAPGAHAGKTILMTELLSGEAERKDWGIRGTTWISFKYLIFGIAVVVALMLNVGGTQDLQIMVGLSQVLHCCDHVQGVDPIKKQQINKFKHIMLNL